MIPSNIVHQVLKIQEIGLDLRTKPLIDQIKRYELENVELQQAALNSIFLAQMLQSKDQEVTRLKRNLAQLNQQNTIKDQVINQLNQQNLKKENDSLKNQIRGLYEECEVIESRWRSKNNNLDEARFLWKTSFHLLATSVFVYTMYKSNYISFAFFNPLNLFYIFKNIVILT